MTDTLTKERRTSARMRRDLVMQDIEKVVARRAVAEAREKMKIIIYDAQAKALEELKETFQ
jgi:hypothetical protein